MADFVSKFLVWRPGCTSCNDHRFVYDPAFDRVPCPKCGCTCGPHQPGTPRGECEGDRRSKDLKFRAYLATHGVPEITIADLTPLEYERLLGFRVRFHNTSDITFLSWIEGARYEPAKDAAFVAECDAEMDRWRTWRDERVAGAA